MKIEVIGFIAALASAASWAFCTVMFDRIGKVVPYAGITFLKGVFSIMLMGVLTLFMGDLSSVGGREFLILALSGIIGIAIGDTLFFRSLQDLGAKVQVLYFMLGQVVTMLLSFMLLGDILTIGEYLGALVLLIGIVIVTWGKQEDHPNKRRGIIGGFLSILCFSVSTIMVKMAIGHIDVVTATFYRMIFGTLAVLFVGVTSNKIAGWVQPLHDRKLLSLFLLNVVVLTLGGFLLSMLAIKSISVSLASVLSTTEPIFVLLFAWLINKEQVSRRELVGAAVTIAGVLIIIFNE
jgi:drug/metabolite transporter (DMT)-like permease